MILGRMVTLAHFTAARAALAFVLLIALPALVAQDQGVAAKVDAIVKKHMQKPAAVGLSLGVARRGTVLLATAYGLADAELDVPANADTLFRIGSITKQFSSAMIMRLVEKGELSLDDRLGKLLPDAPFPAEPITLRHLLDHTSGIPSYTDLGREWVKKQPLELTDQELLALIDGKPLTFAPGEGWHYNNTGYYLLGMLLSKRHGKPYAQVLQDELCKPLGPGTFGTAASQIALPAWFASAKGTSELHYAVHPLIPNHARSSGSVDVPHADFESPSMIVYEGRACVRHTVASARGGSCLRRAVHPAHLAGLLAARCFRTSAGQPSVEADAHIVDGP